MHPYSPSTSIQSYEDRPANTCGNNCNIMLLEEFIPFNYTLIYYALIEDRSYLIFEDNNIPMEYLYSVFLQLCFSVYIEVDMIVQFIPRKLKEEKWTSYTLPTIQFPYLPNQSIPRALWLTSLFTDKYSEWVIVWIWNWNWAAALSHETTSRVHVWKFTFCGINEITILKMR